MSATSDESRQYAQVSVRVEAPDAKSAQPPAAEPGKLPGMIAVLICHGMGQQVQFETLDSVAREVRDAAESCGTLVASKPVRDAAESWGALVTSKPDIGVSQI